MTEGMTAREVFALRLPTLSTQDFNRFRDLIKDRCGVRLSDAKKNLLKNRLGKRLRANGFTSYKDYYDYVTSRKGASEELEHLLGVITTHQTHFFREPHHFNALVRHCVPALLKKNSRQKKLRVWSAGCSSGQEVFTLAAVLLEALKPHGHCVPSILGSDIDYNVLNQARAGVYPRQSFKEIPSRYLKYFEIQRDELVVRDQIRDLVTFKQQNLRKLENIGFRPDIIFCRNVVMYFDADFRKQLTAYYHRLLRDDGYLFLGSSESMHGMPHLFRHNSYHRTVFYAKPKVHKESV